MCCISSVLEVSCSSNACFTNETLRHKLHHIEAFQGNAKVVLLLCHQNTRKWLRLRVEQKRSILEALTSPGQAASAWNGGSRRLSWTLQTRALRMLWDAFRCRQRELPQTLQSRLSVFCTFLISYPSKYFHAMAIWKCIDIPQILLSTIQLL